MKTEKLFFVILLAIFTFETTTMNAQNKKSFEIQIENSSIVRIQGSSNVNNFTFEQRGPFVTKPLFVELFENSNHDLVNPISLPIEINKFQCDNRLMKRDFFHTLNAEIYPFMTITITKIYLPNQLSPKENTTLKGNVNILVTLSGKSCDYQIPFLLVSDRNKLSIMGQKKMFFSDFNLTPPSKLFGAIQVNNDLLISVNLIVKFSAA